MKIAIEGCCHGELDRIYETINQIENDQQIKIDLLLICGDFQAVRNEHDLQSMAVPPKYRSMQDFWRYYSGEKRAPVLTIFIGGNHESSNFLIELPYGGWVAPNIYYMGYANVVNFNGLRIAGLSGIYKYHDYHSGHFELPPFDEKSVRSIYHIRSLDVYRIKQLQQGQIDIVISHDWPRGIVWYGDTQRLLQRKQYFQQDIYSNQLGSEPLEEVLLQVQPKYWFSAHLHVKFSALVEHTNGQLTRFLALDKCLPGRDFLQILDIEPLKPSPSPTNRLSLDPEWLCILSKTDHLLHVQRTNIFLPSSNQNSFTPNEDDYKKIHDDFSNTFEIPEMFEITGPVHQPDSGHTPVDIEQLRKNNPQTELLCLMLGIRNPIDVILNRKIQPIQFDQTN
jgi:lariat debranching enzyme